MHFSELTAPEQRVLGCLIEKRWTTPDQYPLSLNALRLACNQATNRDPVTDFDESTVREAAQRLSRYGLARLASGHSSRATKYRHLADESFGLDRPALAALAVLLLRGPQTPGEIKGRSERLAPGFTLADTEAVLATLTERGLAARMPRRPGQKEERFRHLLGEAAPASAAAAGALEAAAFAPATVSSETPSAAASGPPPAAPRVLGPLHPGPSGPPDAPAPPGTAALTARVEALEAEVGRLRDELARLADEPRVTARPAADRMTASGS